MLTNTIYLPQETKVKHPPQTKVEECPEIEKFIPYDPLGNYDISCTITFQAWDLKEGKWHLISCDHFLCESHCSITQLAFLSLLMVCSLRTQPIEAHGFAT